MKTKCDHCGIEADDHPEGDRCLVCQKGYMLELDQKPGMSTEPFLKYLVKELSEKWDKR